MATITFRLKSDPGQRRVRKLFADFSCDQGRLKISPQVEVDITYWSQEQQQLLIPRHAADSRAFNEQLEAFRARTMARWLESGQDLARFRELLDTARGSRLAPVPEPEAVLSVQDLIDLRLQDKQLSDSASTRWAYQQLRTLVGVVNQDQPLPVDRLTYSFYARLRAHLVTEQGMINSSANRFLSKLKTALTHAATRHTERLGTELAGQVLSLVPRLDKLPDEEPDIIAPELADVLHLASLDLLEEPELALTRDRYVFACFTGPRHSDLNALEGVNLLQEDEHYFLRYMPIKTKRRTFVQVPVNRFAHELLGRWLGEEATLLPSVDNRRENEFLHRLLRDFAGPRFHNIVEQVSFSGGLRVVSRVPRWQAITFHTSRHFFAITLINLGVPLQHVQDLLGQRNLTSTMRYAKARRQDVQRTALTALETLQLPQHDA